MVKLSGYASQGGIQSRQVRDPADRSLGLAAHGGLDLEGMAMHAPIEAVLWTGGQEMGRVKLRRLGDFKFRCVHGLLSPPTRTALFSRNTQIFVGLDA